MYKAVSGAVSLLVCSVSFAQVREAPLRFTGVNCLRGRGGNTAGATVYYQNTNGPCFMTMETPRAHGLDLLNWAPGPGAGHANILVNRMVWGLATLTPTPLDVYFRFWEDWQDCTLRTQILPNIYFSLPPLSPQYFWIITVDLSGLPGGGLTFPNGPSATPNDFCCEQLYTVAGTHTDLATFGFAGGDPDGDGVSEGPQVGWSSDVYYRDTNNDGIFTCVDPDEARNFGGSPHLANFFLQLSHVASCDPCDANCDGTDNLFDIQAFVDVLRGTPGCSPCVGDTDDNGTVNLFDIQGFVDCLGAP